MRGRKMRIASSSGVCLSAYLASGSMTQMQRAPCDRAMFKERTIVLLV